MYVTGIPNRGKKPTILLRESFREDGKVKNRTLANLTMLPPPAIEALKRVLAGEKLTAPEESFEIESSVQHGHVDAVMTAIRKTGLDQIISSRRCRERDLVVAMIAARVLSPASKLKTTRWWNVTTLPKALEIEDASEDDLYAAMDWLLERQPAIEKKLAARHLKPCSMVLYDLTSTWVEGTNCPLAALGYSRDRRKNSLQINFGLLTDDEGRPIAVSVYKGNTADPKTVQDQVKKLKEEFKLDLVAFVGDRGMVTQAQIDKFVEEGGIDWITALKTGAIRKLKAEGKLQLGLFDDRNLFELESPEFPGERLVACRNPELAKSRAHKRDSLIKATVAELEKVRRMVERGSVVDRAEIGVRVGRVIDKYKVAKHFKVEIQDGLLKYTLRSDKIDAEAALDGLYVIRTSLLEEVLSAEDAVRNYKRLTRVERAFRSMKTISLKVRPIYHHLENRVRAHILLCMLAYYVEWHMRRALAPLLFADEVDTRDTRDPVKPARPSEQAIEKAQTKRTPDGMPVHSFDSLIDSLASIVKNRCRRIGAPKREPCFEMTTRPNAVQARALELINTL